MAEKITIDYTKKLCSKCTSNPDRKANVYCQNCTAYLCSTCFDTHQNWPDFKHHVTITIEDLASGKVQITKKEDPKCTDHEGEQMKFYCVTCQKLVCRDCILMKQHCRDHNYVTLKEAAEEKLNDVKQAMKECEDKKKECQDIILETKAISSKLNRAGERIKLVNELLKTDYMKQVERFYAKQNVSVAELCSLEERKLTEASICSQDNLKRIERAGTQGQAFVESDSHYNILANSKYVLETLQQVNKMALNKLDTSVVKFPASVSMGDFNQSWKQIGGFTVECTYYPTGIAVTSDGKVAVCDNDHCVKVLFQSGELLHTFDGNLGGCGDICITSNDTYLYPHYTDNKLVIKRRSTYQVISKFKTFNVNKDEAGARTVTADKDGFMIFGMTDNAISIHNPDESLKCSYPIPYQPSSVAVTSYAEIVVVSNNNDSVQLFDYSGNCLHTVDPPDEVKAWKPRYVCCSTTDEVLVVNRGDPKGIYKYMAGRVYMGCVTREVDVPYGIALSHDDNILYVTEARKKEVKMFQRP